MCAIFRITLLICTAVWTFAADPVLPVLLDGLRYHIVSSTPGDVAFVAQIVAQAGRGAGLSDQTAMVSDLGAIRFYADRSIPISIDARREKDKIIVVIYHFTSNGGALSEKKLQNSYRAVESLLTSSFTKRFGDRLTVTDVAKKKEPKRDPEIPNP